MSRLSLDTHRAPIRWVTPIFLAFLSCLGSSGGSFHGGPTEALSAQQPPRAAGSRVESARLHDRAESSPLVTQNAPLAEVWYVLIDRGTRETVNDLATHKWNIAGVRTAVLAEFGGKVTVKVKSISKQGADDLNGLDRKFWADPVEYWDSSPPSEKPLAIFSAGSSRLWEDLRTDETWRREIEGYISFLRDKTSIPILAVCGSHQLVALAWGGSIVHMVSQTNALATPHPLADPGEYGVFPIRAVDPSSKDPLAQLVVSERRTLKDGSQDTLMAFRHSDEIGIVPAGFEVLFTSNDTVGWYYRADLWFLPQKNARIGTGNIWSMGDTDKKTSLQWRVRRGRVQGLRLDSRDRLLYTTEFHPEMDNFFAKHNDEGNGQAFLRTFFRMSGQWWRDHSNFKNF
jgi:GMP synthase-like glutamine amidotransferase